MFCSLIEGAGSNKNRNKKSLDSEEGENHSTEGGDKGVYDELGHDMSQIEAGGVIKRKGLVNGSGAKQGN